MKIDEVLELVKIRISIEDEKHDNLLEIFIKEIGYRMLHFMNREDMPKELVYTWSSMVIDFIESEHPQLIPGYEEDRIAAAISGLNIKVGDTDISSGSSGGNSSSTDKSKRKESTMADLISNYKIDLIRYRKMRF